MEAKGKTDIFFVTFYFVFLRCIYVTFNKSAGLWVIVLFLSLYFCFQIHNQCLTILIFWVVSKCRHICLHVIIIINVKEALQAPNNAGCPGFAFHCLHPHLPKLNIIIPLCLQICQTTSCTRHDSICCLLKSYKAEYIFLLNAMLNSILEFNCSSFVKLKENVENKKLYIAFREVGLFSSQQYFYFQFDHFKRNWLFE